MNKLIPLLAALAVLLAMSYSLLMGTRNFDVNAPIGWKVSGKYLPPQCLVREWMSSDNFEAFEEKMLWTDIEHFRKKPGLYLGNRLNVLQPLNASWGDRLTLTPTVEDCFAGLISDGQILKENTQLSTQIKFRDVYGESCDSSGSCTHSMYQVLKTIELDLCDSLAPSIEGTCQSSYLISNGGSGGGSMGHNDQFIIYGIFELEDKTQIIAPLRVFDSQHEAMEFEDADG